MQITRMTADDYRSRIGEEFASLPDPSSTLSSPENNIYWGLKILAQKIKEQGYDLRAGIQSYGPGAATGGENYADAILDCAKCFGCKTSLQDPFAVPKNRPSPRDPFGPLTTCLDKAKR